MFGGDGAGGGGAQVGEFAFVKEGGQRLAGLLAKKQHHASAGRESEAGVVVESRSDLDDEMVVTPDVSVFDMNVAGRFFEYHFADRRHDDFSL